MSTSPPSTQEVELASTIHLEFIRNLAEHPGEDAREAVDAYHRALYMHRHGRDLERFQQLRQTHEDRLAFLEPRLQKVREELSHLKPLCPVEGGPPPGHPVPQPWHGWDVAMFVAALMGILALLIFGVFNVSFNLLESGLVTFMENPVRAYFWAALLPVGALAVKVGWDVLPGARSRGAYLWTSLMIGLAGVLVWMAAYATLYPTLSQSTDEQIAALRVFDGGNPEETGLASPYAKRIDTVIVMSQAMAEIFLSAVLGMYMTLLHKKHRRVRLSEGPGFRQWDQERRDLEAEIAATRQALAEAKGEEGRLLHQLTVFLAFAKSLYDKEAHRRQDRGYQKRQLLERITEDFKARLESVENDPAFGQDEESPRLALRSQSIS